MGVLTPDRGLSRRLAIGYVFLVLAVPACASAAFVLLERREEDGLRDEISRAARDGAARLSRELRAACDSLPPADPRAPREAVEMWRKALAK